MFRRSVRVLEEGLCLEKAQRFEEVSGFWRRARFWRPYTLNLEEGPGSWRRVRALGGKPSNSMHNPLQSGVRV